MDVDVAVLGGGPGGYTAAIRAAQLGLKVACIEREPELGGTCLRVGCIPTKAWVQTAFALKQANETFEKLGVKVGPPELDFSAAQQWKEGIVKQLTGGVAMLFKANGIEWVKGVGRFKDANTLAVEGGARGPAGEGGRTSCPTGRVGGADRAARCSAGRQGLFPPTLADAGNQEHHPDHLYENRLVVPRGQGSEGNHPSAGRSATTPLIGPGTADLA